MADYAISNVPRRVVYAASGTGPYAFTFEILNQTDIAVYKASTLLTLTTDYTVTINANGTGSVTLIATAGTSNITIVGAKNIQRTSDYTTGGDLFASTLNTDLDSLTIFSQQVAETAERGLKAPVTDPTDIAMTLPPKATRAGTVLAFNATTGNPETGPSIASVTTVAAQSANINTVATNIASVNTVAGNSSNINTVAGVSGNVTTVAGSISNVNTVADDLNEAVSEINTVAVNIFSVINTGSNISSVNTVAGNMSSVTSVAGNASNINTVAGISSAVSNVSSISSAVTGVNSNSTNINTVAGQITPTNNVSTVAGISANVSTVAGNSSNVTTVAGISGNVTTVAGISANVTTVANNSANVTTVAGISSNVTTVATNIANVNQVAADTAVINSASANATTATTKAAEALASANSASASAAAASAVVLSNEPVRPTVRPSLLLDFANTKALDPRVSFSRPTTATYYDNHTTAVAEQNLFTYSEQFDNGIWVKSSLVVVTANTTTAPDGQTTADTLTSNTATVNSGLYQASTTVIGNTFSVYAKAGTSNFVGLTTSFSNATPWANFNLSTGVVSSSSGCTASIVSVGNGWYRCIMANTTVAGQSFCYVIGKDADPAGNPWNTGTWTSGNNIYIWGAQLEQRSTVTAYTPTTTTAITNYIPVLLTQQSNEARFDHNPTTRESLGLLIEEQRTNLLTYSEQFDNAVWTKLDATITGNTIVSPNGTQVGDLLVYNSTNTQHYLRQDISGLTNAATYTISVYAKAGGYNRFDLFGGFSSATGSATFDLSTGTVTAGTGQIVAVGNGWFRCSTQVVMSGTTIFLLIRGLTNASGAFFAGDGFSGLYIWGAQLEAGAFATSYIPTVASQVTRSADSASMTGANFSSWYNIGQGTWYGSVLTRATNSAPRIVGTSNSSRAPLGMLSGLTGFMFDGAGVQSGNTSTVNTITKLATSWVGTTGSVSLNGGAVVTGSQPTGYANITIINIGNDSGNGQFLNSTIYKIAYYPIAVSSANLIALTGN